IGRVQRHVDRVVVDLGELGVGRDVAQEVGAVGADPIGGEQHVVGGEWVAIVKFDALAEMEAPFGRAQRLQLSASAGMILRSLSRAVGPLWTWAWCAIVVVSFSL